MRVIAPLSALTCVAFALLGCTDEKRISVRELISARDSGSVHILEFAVPLHDLTNTAEIQVLEEDLVLGERAEFGAVADIAALGDGRFAVLDRVDKSITVFDSSGQVTRKFGREGKGPGEFNYPWAITAVGDRIVVWQWAPNQTFITFDTGGNVLATAGERIDGDWRRYAFRTPSINIEGDQRGIEDITRRLVSLSDSEFAHMVQPDEIKRILEGKWQEEMPPPSMVVRYEESLDIRDTVAVLDGARLLLRKEIPRGMGPIVEQSFFAGLPFIAAGNGWLATGHGDSTRLRVVGEDGTPLLIIQFSQAQSVSLQNKVDAAEWYTAIESINSPASYKRYREIGVREFRKQLRKWLPSLPFAKAMPIVGAAYGVNDCLFLAGSSSDDSPDGTSLTWAVINVRTGSLLSAIRIPPRGSRKLPHQRYPVSMRTFDDHFAYVVTRNEDGMSLLHRFRLPDVKCQS